MADMEDRKFDYEEPRLTERQKRLDAEDVYWCGSERLELCVTGCEWEDNGNGQWETTCGKSFEFNEGGPIANGFEFCPFCGLSLDELPYLDADE